MRLYRCLCLLLPLTLFGCSEFEGPESGTWRYTAVTPVRNDCNWNTATNPPGDFAIVNNGDTFRVTPEDDNPQFDCSLDGYGYTCSERIAGSYSEGGSTLTWKVDAKGTFIDERSGSGSQTGQVTCSGSACPSVAQLLNTTFPCRLDVDFVIGRKN
ncbi:MAG: hypothetical protein H0U74_06245 [Bradymonadaceae bacterium]|nr:hypothetical protein [Lujinxingiaceae bacterium]